MNRKQIQVYDGDAKRPESDHTLAGLAIACHAVFRLNDLSWEAQGIAESQVPIFKRLRGDIKKKLSDAHVSRMRFITEENGQIELHNAFVRTIRIYSNKKKIHVHFGLTEVGKVQEVPKDRL